MNVLLLFRHLPCGQRRHVARTVRHHRHEPAPRFPALVVGHVRADVLGFLHVPRTIGLFLALLFLFLRFLPMISIFEMRTMLPEAKVDHEWEDVD